MSVKLSEMGNKKVKSLEEGFVENMREKRRVEERKMDERKWIMRKKE